MKMPTLDERAMQWANNNNKSDGFVILDPEFNITGWCKSLENNANTFVPGCTGIGLNGEWFMTRGGDAYNGAEEWIQFKYVTKKKGRPATGKAKSNAERMKEYRARKAKEMKRLEIVAHNAEQIADIERDISRDQFDEIERLRAENEHLRAMRNVTKKAESNDGAFDALASKLAMTEKAFLSSQGEIKRLYAEIAELQREVVKLSKKPKNGFL
jgi:hypothetical protein